MRKLTITFIVLALCVPLLVAFKLVPRELPLGECHPIYRRYASDPHVAAAYLRDFRLDDSVTVGVVTLLAKDSATWFMMLEDLKVGKGIIADARKKYEEKSSSCIMFNIEKNASLQRTEGCNKRHDMVICTVSDLTISIYDIRNDTQEDIIVEKEFQKLEQP